MNILLKALLTLAAGGGCGIILRRLKVPNGLRIGALLGSALLSIFFRAAWMPSQTKFAVQIIAGAIIGSAIGRNDLKQLPRLMKPTAIIVISLLILNLTGGILIHRISPLDWVTSFLCFIPGGLSEIPIIAADMGADAPKVAIAQLARYFLGVGAFPPMVMAVNALAEKSRRKNKDKKPLPRVADSAEHTASAETRQKKNESIPALICTLAASAAGGLLGDVLGIPGGVFLFSVLMVFFLNITFSFAGIPNWLKKITLVVSGCYIGSLITMNDVLNFRLLALPVLVIIAGYILNCFVTGAILHKTTRLSLIEAMMSTSPAGASDLALSSAEMGIKSTDIVIIQVFRSTIAIAIFPQIINALLLVFDS